MEFELVPTRHGYAGLLQALELVAERDRVAALRWLCRYDLWFLLRHACGRVDMEPEHNPKMADWLFARVREVDADPDWHLDLWARGHYKSTIITFGLTIQDLLRGYGTPETYPLPNPRRRAVREPTTVIFSHTRGIAKAFLRQIKAELSGNSMLKDLFPDILYAIPEKESPKWSEDDGLIVKRQGNPKEACLEAWGLVDGQPTGKHFDRMIYDDVVTLASVTTPEMVAKTNEAWEMSLNLGSTEPIRRYIGTRYAFNDTYRHIINRAELKPRIHAATDDGTPSGKPVMLHQHTFNTRWREMGPYIGASQLLQNPVADAIQGFKREWLRFYEGGGDFKHMNKYLLVDPASEKKKQSDFTAMAVMGLGSDGNIYLLDAVRDRLNLKERTLMTFLLHQKWRPKLTGYEKYGMQADIEHIKSVMKIENYRFDVVELGGPMPKPDRIRRLLPYASESRLYLPVSLYRTLYDGRTYDITQMLIEEEFIAFPVGVHDDLLDAMARIFDLTIAWPKREQTDEVAVKRFEKKYGTKLRGTWMGR